VLMIRTLAVWLAVVNLGGRRSASTKHLLGCEMGHMGSAVPSGCLGDTLPRGRHGRHVWKQEG